MDLAKDDDGNKIYTNCSAYRYKTKDLESLKQTLTITERNIANVQRYKYRQSLT